MRICILGTKDSRTSKIAASLLSELAGPEVETGFVARQVEVAAFAPDYVLALEPTSLSAWPGIRKRAVRLLWTDLGAIPDDQALRAGLKARLERLLRLERCERAVVENREVPYRGRVFDLEVDRIRLPQGQRTELEILRHQGAATVLPLTDRGTALLIVQYRHAANGLIWEVPAGKIDGDETPEACALREIVEEAGVEAGRLHPLGGIWTTPGFTDEVIHLFAATGLLAARQDLDHDEVIEVEEVPWSQVLAMAHGGEIRDGKTLCTVLRADAEIRAGRLPFSAR